MNTEETKKNSWFNWGIKALITASAVITFGAVTCMLFSMLVESEGALISQPELDVLPNTNGFTPLTSMPKAEIETTFTSSESNTKHTKPSQRLRSTTIEIVNSDISPRDMQVSGTGTIERTYNSLSVENLFPGENRTLNFNANNLFSDADGGVLKLDVTVDDQESSWVECELDPKLLGSQNKSTSARHFDAIDQTAYLPNGNTVELVSLENPAKPETIRYYQVPGCVPEDIKMVGVQGYVAGGTTVYVADFQNPNDPQLLGTYTTADSAKRIDVDRNIAAVTLSPSGIIFLNVTKPTPELMSTLPDTAADIKLTRHYAYLAEIDGIKIFDKRDPANPVEIASFATQGSALAVEVVNEETAYVIDSSSPLPSRIIVLDVRNAVAPILLDSYEMLGDATDIEVAGSMVFVVDNLGLHVIDASDSTKLVPMVSYEGFNSIQSIRVVGTFAEIIDANAGLQVIDLRWWKLIMNPKTEDVGNPHVKVRATDVLGSETSTSFTAKVQGPPEFAAALSDQVGTVGDAFYLLIPPAIDPNNDPVELHAEGLPPGLQFNPISGVIAGTPTVASNGPVKITVTDNIAGTREINFNLKIGYQPKVAATIRNPAPFREGSSFSYTVPDDAFSDLNGNVLLFSATLDNNKPWPDWLTFDAKTKTFSGIPPVGNNSKFTIIITATDSITGASVSQSVQFSTQTNKPPVLAKPIPEQRVPAGKNYRLTLDPNMFTDPNNDRLNITVHGLPGELHFDQDKLTITGKPTISSNIAPYTDEKHHFTVTASDGEFSTSVVVDMAVYGKNIWTWMINSTSYVIGGSTFLYSLYKARALVLNCCGYRFNQSGSIQNNVQNNQEVFIPLDCDPEKIKTVQARIKLSAPNSCWTKMKQCLFGSTVAFFGAYLPPWLKYSRQHNGLIIDASKLTPNDIGELTMEVTGSDGVLLRRFDIALTLENGEFKITVDNHSVVVRRDAENPIEMVFSAPMVSSNLYEDEQGISMSHLPASPSL